MGWPLSALSRPPQMGSGAISQTRLVRIKQKIRGCAGVRQDRTGSEQWSHPGKKNGRASIGRAAGRFFILFRFYCTVRSTVAVFVSFPTCPSQSHVAPSALVACHSSPLRSPALPSLLPIRGASGSGASKAAARAEREPPRQHGLFSRNSQNVSRCRRHEQLADHTGSRSIPGDGEAFAGDGAVQVESAAPRAAERYGTREPLRPTTSTVRKRSRLRHRNALR